MVSNQAQLRASRKGGGEGVFKGGRRLREPFLEADLDRPSEDVGPRKFPPEDFPSAADSGESIPPVPRLPRSHAHAGHSSSGSSSARAALPARLYFETMGSFSFPLPVSLLGRHERLSFLFRKQQTKRGRGSGRPYTTIPRSFSPFSFSPGSDANTKKRHARPRELPPQGLQRKPVLSCSFVLLERVAGSNERNSSY